MITLQALLVDDDKLNSESLSYLLENDCEGIEVIGIADNAESARRFLLENNKKPDVIFLDISMPGESGFEFLASLQERNFEVVFVTGHDEFGLQALKVSAVDYLIKPVIIEELQGSILKIRERYSKHNSLPQTQFIENLLHNFLHHGPSKIALPHISGVKFVELSEIIFLQADSNYTTVMLYPSTKIVLAKSLKDFDELLPSEFIRVHKSNIINLKYVKEYISTNGGEVILSDGSHVAVGKKYYEEFLQRLRQVALIFKK